MGIIVYITQMFTIICTIFILEIFIAQDLFCTMECSPPPLKQNLDFCFHSSQIKNSLAHKHAMNFL